MVQWYPSHMARARKVLIENLKLVDIVVEVLDARIPASSKNPDIDSILDNKKRVIVLNKIDLAHPDLTSTWLDYFRRSYPVMGVNSITGEGIGELKRLLRNEGERINKVLEEKGRQQRPVRIMVIGIPNVGKSAFLNILAGSNRVKTGNRPGVTRGKQWLKLGKGVQLLDTPGILWPKIEDEETGHKLAITGAIDENNYDKETAAYKLVCYLMDIDSEILEKTYNIGIYEGLHPYDIVELIGKQRGCYMSGGKIDRHKTSEIILNDFRRGKMGRITLEKPELI
ncbi:GTP-binding protein HSR1-related [Halothermothrix orenii H 168]|uniref:Ribosome biogenesis GTPase A n=1 Tax=Halothermothrix orenii (strain H 168 / OCM 544 / DSM 9562) TaxID=373903 RepID=B8CW24_HALOH|nr:ribosome biogenesis GTPase YlqF [Halothermothrix orenii]ACL69493.1 GTP-binding protein HSR1-related [Halothermothrix orenii H 168]